MILVHTKNHEFDNAYLRPIPGVVLSCTECQRAIWMLLLSVASKGTINAESLKVFLLTSFKFTKLSLSNPTSNLCLFNCKTLRYWYWFGVPWTRWTCVPITPAGRTRFWRISKVLRSSGCARMRSAVVMAPVGFGVQISKLQPFPCFYVETREWRDILIS